MKAFTGKGGQLFNLFEASAMMSTLARLSGRSDDGADGVMTGDLEAIASGTLLPKKVRIHVCGRVAQEGDGLVGEQERMIHVRGVGVEGWDGTEEGRGVYESDEALEEIFEVFGPYVRATIRHRVQNGQNTSWALVTMGDTESLDRALAAPRVMAGDTALVLTRVSAEKAAASTGGMAAVRQEVLLGAVDIRLDDPVRLFSTVALPFVAPSSLPNVAAGSSLGRSRLWLTNALGCGPVWCSTTIHIGCIKERVRNTCLRPCCSAALLQLVCQSSRLPAGHFRRRSGWHQTRTAATAAGSGCRTTRAARRRAARCG